MNWEGNMYTRLLGSLLTCFVLVLYGCGGSGAGESSSLISVKQDVKGTYSLNKISYLARENVFRIYTSNSNTTMRGTLVIGRTSWKEKIFEADNPLFGNISTTSTGTYSEYSNHQALNQGTATWTFSDGSKTIVHLNYDSNTRITIHYPFDPPLTIIPAFTLLESLETWDKISNLY